MRTRGRRSHRGRKRKRPIRPQLNVLLILAWADAFFARKNRWPNINSGRIPETIDDTWRRIDDALRNGYRGLQRRSRLSLARLLERHRGVRNSEYPPKLTVGRIIAWVKAHHRRLGQWPNAHSGDIPEAPGESWLAIEMSLRKGRRGLSGGSSLAALLQEQFEVRNPARLPRLEIRHILLWADAFYRRTGRWPNGTEGKTVNAHGEKWSAINAALVNGRRGLPGGSSLSQLLRQERGAQRANSTVPRLKCAEILKWAKSFRRKTGAWPTRRTKLAADSHGTTWSAINAALRLGLRGLEGGSSLAKLIEGRRDESRTR